MFTIRPSRRKSRPDRGNSRPRCVLERLEQRWLLSGVTMLTHGHWGNAAAGGWIDHMASAIAEEAVAAGLQDVAIYKMTVEDAGNDTIAVRTPVRESGPASWEEAVIKVDWSELSTGIFWSTPTGDVADAIAGYLLTQPVDGRWLLESPIHLVGHSRGASLQSVLAGRLGQFGIWVDQLTTLDPHPVDGLGGDDFMNYGDAPMRVWPNVRFADNYWREDVDPTDFDGEAVSGALNLHLSEDVLGEGVFPDVGFGAEHSDVHLWYHGTIDTTGPVDDGEVETPITDAAGWYEGNMGPRDETGFHFSRIAGGVRPSQGLAAAGAYRDPLSLTVAGIDVWDNVEITGFLDDRSVTVGDPIDLSVAFDDLNEDAIIGVGYDTDTNPYNGAIGTNRQWQVTGPYDDTMPFSLATDGMVPGEYYIWALITNDEHVRYYYAPGKLDVEQRSAAEIVGRHLFYNNSAFDGNRAEADLLDDWAVATDKRALRPGQTASSSNYTSYDRGINGLMIDIEGLHDAEQLSAVDFTLKVGNDDTPSTWTTAPAPDAITVRPGAGTRGSDRVSITWNDHLIEKQWLQVTVRATERTGIARPDVFYFGNAVAEAGDQTINTIVNATDEIVARNFGHGPLDPATIEDPYDYDRDGRVDGTDQILARNNQTNPLTMLRLITAPQSSKAALDSPAEDSVLSAELDWRYQFDAEKTHRRTTKQRAELAVDTLLATYWS